MNPMRFSCFTLSFLIVVPMLTGSSVANDVFIDPIYDYVEEADLVYGTGALLNPLREIDLELDLYRPTAPPGIRPAIVLVHGGGFTSGSRGDLEAVAKDYAKRGYVASTITYRLAGDDPAYVPGPVDTWGNNVAIHAAISDASSAVQWMRTNADQYGVDPNRIVLGGYSAGAITSLLQAYGDTPDGAEVAAVVSWAGGLYGLEDFIQADDPPLVLVHGDTDSVVPFSNATAINRQAEAVSLPIEFVRVPGEGHSISLSTNVDGVSIQEPTFAFLAEQMNLAELAASYSVATQEVVTANSEAWKFFPGLSEPTAGSLAWTLTDFDDSAWTSGTDGFGYGPEAEEYGVNQELDDMKGNYSSLFLRHEFDIDASVQGTDALIFELNYDDGFIVYVNGEKVLQQNIDSDHLNEESVPFDARPLPGSSNGRVQFYIDLESRPDLLSHDHQNVLAIHGLNRRISDRDFYLSQIGLSAAVPEPIHNGMTLFLTLLFLIRLRNRRATDLG